MNRAKGPETPRRPSSNASLTLGMDVQLNAHTSSPFGALIRSESAGSKGWLNVAKSTNPVR